MEGQKNSVATAACYCFDAQPKAAIEAVISIGMAMVAGSGSSTTATPIDITASVAAFS